MRLENRTIQITIDTGSPVSFLNRATTKKVSDKFRKSRLSQAEKLNLAAKYDDYNKQPILVLRSLKTL